MRQIVRQIVQQNSISAFHLCAMLVLKLVLCYARLILSNSHVATSASGKATQLINLFFHFDLEKKNIDWIKVFFNLKL